MEQFFKQLTKDLLVGVNSYSTRLTNKKEVELLVHKLRPIYSDNKLIRLGPKGDGGYLLPDDLTGIKACFSPGVSDVSGFEKDCADLGMSVFLADKSVKQPAEFHERFHFTKKHIGITTNDEFMTIDDWVTTSLLESQEDLLLQIDIEGYEYETFISASNLLMSRFRIIVAEFHDLHVLWSKPFFRLASHTFEKILQTHTCVHIHPNNCCGSVTIQGLEIPRIAEFTFLRNDRVKNPSFATVFPHSLDEDNQANKPHLPLPKWWYNP